MSPVSWPFCLETIIFVSKPSQFVHKFIDLQLLQHLYRAYLTIKLPDIQQFTTSFAVSEASHLFLHKTSVRTMAKFIAPEKQSRFPSSAIVIGLSFLLLAVRLNFSLLPNWLGTDMPVDRKGGDFFPTHSSYIYFIYKT